MREKTKIAVLVSGGGTNLQALLDAEKRGEIPDGEIVLVVGSRDGIYALERAEKAGVEHCVVHKDEPKLIETLKEHGIQLVILAGYLTILSEKFIETYRDRIINIHPSLIPSFCGKGMYGLKPHEACLARGCKVTGATVHLVNEIPDGGRILLQKAVEIQPGDTPEILQKRVMEQAEWKLLPAAAEMMAKEIRES
ncbi:MAG: phosphoribosylglycinamide formyltransferase [Oribacterium sp.]|jgi:phosphoribosylglycinamide formyltransferase-1|nr:phosphoribosylglycinamide formyltransferase [Oribacterium sp.]MDY6317092.1 phosphoribosylglycinamide formyltransferase [Oribacterium sp.]